MLDMCKWRNLDFIKKQILTLTLTKIDTILFVVSGSASSVGNMPGVTRSVLTKIRMSNDPLIYLIDTPGIMMPNMKDMHIAMKLALCGTHLQNFAIFYGRQFFNFTGFSLKI